MVAEFKMDPATDHQSVQIYLPVDDADKPIPFLSIPRNDIQRLSIRPLKWIRFVMFSIVGARGDLFEEPGGLQVDYTSTSLGKGRYYYNPSEGFAFVDPDGLNDRKTTTSSTSLSERAWDFRERVMARDAHCVFTSMDADVCDAAHIIPRSKGDEYIEMVIAMRLHLYNSTERPTILGIDDIQNGISLNAVLHRSFGHGAFTLLKTPNFAMASTDIPRIERGSTHGDHITLHHLKAPKNYDPVNARRILDDAVSGHQPRPLAALEGFHVDALFEGTTHTPIYPPAIILDFAYGVAAYRHWKCGPVHDVVNDYSAEHYKSIPSRPHDNDNIDWGDDPDDAPGHVSDDANDLEYRPPQRKKKHSRQRGNELAVAMDEMNIVLMRLSGTTPAKEAEKREKRIEEEELRAREAGRMKVMEWRKSVCKS